LPREDGQNLQLKGALYLITHIDSAVTDITGMFVKWAAAHYWQTTKPLDSPMASKMVDFIYF